jgi:hypothetical protein
LKYFCSDIAIVIHYAMIGGDIGGFHITILIQPVAVGGNGIGGLHATTAALRQRAVGLQIDIFAGDIAEVIDFARIGAAVLLKRLNGGLASRVNVAGVFKAVADKRQAGVFGADFAFIEEITDCRGGNLVI